MYVKKCCRARIVPYALRKKVENDLDILKKENVIQKVEHSDWTTPIVVVPKQMEYAFLVTSG